MGCRLAVDALIGQAPVIDALLEAFTLQNAIGVVGPCLPPFQQFVLGVPLPYLGAKARPRNLTGG